MKSTLFYLAALLALPLSSAVALPTEELSEELLGISFTAVEPSNPAFFDSQDIDAAATFQAFSGTDCDGDAGNIDTITSTNRCILATGRQSFYISAGHNYVSTS